MSVKPRGSNESLFYSPYNPSPKHINPLTINPSAYHPHSATISNPKILIILKIIYYPYQFPYSRSHHKQIIK